MISVIVMTFLLVIVAYFDFRNKEISNLAHISILTIGTVNFIIAKENLFLHLAQGVIVFFILLATVCFIEAITDKNVLGGGDIKLFGVLAFFMSYSDFFTMLIFLTIIMMIYVTIKLFFKKGVNAKVAFAPFIFTAYLAVNIYNFLLLNGGIYV